MVKDINIADFDYPLPDEKIAAHPLDSRDSCKLLVALPDGREQIRTFSDLPELLPPGALLCANNARVINARILFTKDTGSRVEVFLLEPHAPADYALMFQQKSEVIWKCLVGNIKRWKHGAISKKITCCGKETEIFAEKIERLDGGEALVRLFWHDPEITFADIIAAAGYIPIPPYLNRSSEPSDSTDYQTVYSEVDGSVAAPTAGLHFTPRILASLRERGIHTEYLTLHVGAGTFRPVKAETIGDHDMHAEAFRISKETLIRIRQAKAEKRPIVAVGTTSVRTLESIPFIARMAAEKDTVGDLSQWEAYTRPIDADPLTLIDALIAWLDKNDADAITAKTSIIIAPGFRWSIVDAMITNFHQPQSTLLLLVASFLSQDGRNPRKWRELYDTALRNGFRFLSYGDACLLFPQK